MQDPLKALTEPDADKAYLPGLIHGLTARVEALEQRAAVRPAEAREWVQASEAARVLGVSARTVRRHAETKFNIRVVRRPGMWARLFNLADVMRAAAGRNGGPPPGPDGGD